MRRQACASCSSTLGWRSTGTVVSCGHWRASGWSSFATSHGGMCEDSMINKPTPHAGPSPDAASSADEPFQAAGAKPSRDFWAVYVYRCDPERSPHVDMVAYGVPRIEK